MPCAQGDNRLKGMAHNNRAVQSEVEVTATIVAVSHISETTRKLRKLLNEERRYLCSSLSVVKVVNMRKLITKLGLENRNSTEGKQHAILSLTFIS